MKKFILSLAVVAAMSAMAVSCSSSASSTEESAQTVVEKIQNAGSQADVQKYVEDARDYAAKLV